MGFDFTGTPMLTIPTDDIIDVCLVARVVVDWLQQANPEVLRDLTAYTGDQPRPFHQHLRTHHLPSPPLERPNMNPNSPYQQLRTHLAYLNLGATAEALPAALGLSAA
jgi:hypothetical protein